MRRSLLWCNCIERVGGTSCIQTYLLLYDIIFWYSSCWMLTWTQTGRSGWSFSSNQHGRRQVDCPGIHRCNTSSAWILSRRCLLQQVVMHIRVNIIFVWSTSLCIFVSRLLFAHIRVLQDCRNWQEAVSLQVSFRKRALQPVCRNLRNKGLCCPVI